jgi:serine protease Do
MASVLQQINQELSQVVQRARQALVHVHNGQRGSGAGTIWHSDGLIITNAHVVGSGYPLSVTLQDGTELPARLLAQDREADLAALVVDTNGLPTMELGRSKDLTPGTWVMALGHPWGVANAVSGGIVIGSGATLPELPPFKNDWIVVSLQMRPGHSGGSLIDYQGRLLGVNTMITGPEVGLAIPVHVVKRFLKQEIV